jgi:ACR3 family arsenite efflux pump ArsB
MKFRKLLHRLLDGGPVLVSTFLNWIMTPTLTEGYLLKLIILQNLTSDFKILLGLAL